MLRRDLKLFFRCLCTAGGLLLLLLALCGAAAAVIARDIGETYTPLKAAVVDHEDSVFSRILVRAAAQSDAATGLMEIERMDEASARAALEAGECAAIIILPDGFVEDILHGRAAGGTVVLSPALRTQASVLASVSRFGETLLAAGQYGVFSGERLLISHSIGAADRARFNEAANAALLGEAASGANRWFRVEITDYAGTGLTSDAHTALVWTAAVLFLVSIAFAPLFETDCTRAMLARLGSLGVGDGAFLLWKWLLPFAFRFLMLAAASAILIPRGLMTGSVSTVLSLTAAAAYVSVLGLCITLCFGDGLSANVLFAVIGLFLTGGLVPRQMLPAILTQIGDLTPFGAAGTLLAPAFGGSADPLGILAAALYSAAAVLLIRRHLSRVRAGRARV